MAKITVIIAALWLSRSLASIEKPLILPTPPMGFNNWARFECGLNQSLFVETADAMVKNGLLEAGYNRINLVSRLLHYGDQVHAYRLPHSTG